MSYTKIKKFNDSFESLTSLPYGEDFLREYDTLCNLVDFIYKDKTKYSKPIIDSNNLFGYINLVVIPVIGKLPDYAKNIKSVNQDKVTEDLQLVTQNLYKLSRLYKDTRFEEYFNHLEFSYLKLMSNFSNSDIESDYFKETGLNNILETIQKLNNKEPEVPQNLVDRLKYYNLYPRLEFFKKELHSKTNIFNSTKYSLIYDEILNSNKDKESEMIATAKQIHKIINNKGNKSSIALQGLKKPLKWENIIILFDGDKIRIKQLDTLLAGDLFLEDIGIRKSKKKGAKTSPLTFFASLFMPEKADQLDSTSNLNQQNKRSVSNSLKELFDTSEDPILIFNKRYKPKFKTSLIGELSEIDIDRHRSGGTFYENHDYTD